MNKMVLGLPLIVLLMAGGGCATRVVSNPSRITLDEALATVARGLVRMHQIEQAEAAKLGQTNFLTGLVPAEADVTFTIAASGSDSSKLYLELSPVPSAGPGKAGAELGSSYEASRGNQITIKFKNILLEPDKNLLGSKSPEEIAKLLRTLQDGGIRFYRAE
jgi:hypothetical protein